LSLTQIDNLEYEDQIKDLYSIDENYLIEKEKENRSINYNRLKEITKRSKSDPEKIIQKKLKRIEKIKDQITKDENYLINDIRNLVIELKKNQNNKDRLDQIYRYSYFESYTIKIIKSKMELIKSFNELRRSLN